MQHSCLLSISASEEFAASNVLQDTFILWARKVLFALKDAGLLNAKQDDKIDYFKEKGITFHGKPVHKNLCQALMSIGKLDAETFQTLRRIDIDFGRNIFSSDYSKMARILQLTSKLEHKDSKFYDELSLLIINVHFVFLFVVVVNLLSSITLLTSRFLQGSGESSSHLNQFIFELAWMLLARQDVEPGFFSLSALDQGGWVLHAATKFTLHCHLTCTGRAANSTNLNAVLDAMETPFLMHGLAPTSHNTSNETGADAADNKYAELVASHNLTRGESRWTDFILSVMIGEHDDSINELLKTVGRAGIVAELSKQGSQHKDNEFIKEYSGALTDLCAKAEPLATDKMSAPTMNLRTIARMASDPSDLDQKRDQIESERNSAWSQLQDVRRWLLQLALKKSFFCSFYYNYFFTS